MTNIEYLISLVGRFDFDESDLAPLLIKQQLQPNEIVNSDNIKIAEKALYEGFPLLFASIPESISEGGFSRKWDRKAILAWYKQFCEGLGLPVNTSQNTLKFIGDRW